MNDLNPNYLPTLLQYFEEELAGVTYFRQLGAHADSPDVHEKFDLLADVEIHAAAMVVPLIEKYQLETRTDEELIAEGLADAAEHRHYTWESFVQYMLERFPLYMDDFHGLETMAPAEDLPWLEALTGHETAAIEFAKREADGDHTSTGPLHAYLAMLRPAANATEA
jgi:hypothetical protein